MAAHFNRGGTQAAPALPDNPVIDLLAQTNAKVEDFDISPDGTRVCYVSAESGGFDVWTVNLDGTGQPPHRLDVPGAGAAPGLVAGRAVGGLRRPGRRVQGAGRRLGAADQPEPRPGPGAAPGVHRVDAGRQEPGAGAFRPEQLPAGGLHLDGDSGGQGCGALRDERRLELRRPADFAGREVDRVPVGQERLPGQQAHGHLACAVRGRVRAQPDA